MTKTKMTKKHERSMKIFDDMSDFEGFLDCGNWHLYGKDLEGFPHVPRAVRVCFSLEVDWDDIYISSNELNESVIDFVADAVSTWADSCDLEVKKRKKFRKKRDCGLIANFGSLRLGRKVTECLEDVAFMNVFFSVEVPDADNDGLETLVELSGVIIDNMVICYDKYARSLIERKDK